ncbi:hypothetical protein E2320_006133, partial [Naja naja]
MDKAGVAYLEGRRSLDNAGEAMTSCFLWQYSLPKVKPGEYEIQSSSPVSLVDILLRHKIRNPGLPALSAIVIYNDTVLWTGNFGKRNGSSDFSGLPNEYSIYRIGSISKLFPTIMLHKLWEDGKITSLDDSLECYAPDFSIKNPLGHLKESKQSSSRDGATEQVAKSEYQDWVSENILERLGMEDTGFDITPNVRSRMTVGVYGSGEVAPLYDLGWYRPSGQMFSTAADLAKLAMVFLGAYHRHLLEPETLKVMSTPLLTCSRDYFANKTGTPWEINEQMGYDLLRKDGDIDGFSATFSLVPKIRLSFIVLMAGPRPQGEDLITQVYEYLIPSLESAFREVEKKLNSPPSPAPYVGYYTFSNLTFYEIKVGPRGELLMQQFGPHIEKVIPEEYRTIKLHHLQDRTFQVVFEKEFPCVLKLGPASISLEAQDGQLFNFYPFDPKGLSPGFDVP